MLGFRVFIIVQKLTYTQNTKCKANEFAEKCTYRNTNVYFQSLNQSSLSLKLFRFQLFLYLLVKFTLFENLYFFSKSFTFPLQTIYITLQSPLLLIQSLLIRIQLQICLHYFVHIFMFRFYSVITLNQSLYNL